MLLSIVFSFRNEEGNIPLMVERIKTATAGIQDFNYELLFVNDDSTDGSLEVLKKLQKNNNITIINMSRRFGVTPCVLVGLENASGDAVLYMDCDLQDPPEIIPKLVAKFREGADVVHTTRTRREGEGRIKLVVTKYAYMLINWLSDVDLPPNTGDFKLMSRRVVDKILQLKEYDPYMRGLSRWVGFKQEFVFYNREPRYLGTTKFPLWSKGPIKEFIRGLTAYSAAPLYASLIFGILVILSCILVACWGVVSKILGVAAPGVSGLMIVIGLLGGSIMISNGIIGLYIARIYYEVKGRPRAIVSDIIK